MENTGGGSFMRNRNLESFLNTNCSPNVKEMLKFWESEEEEKRPKIDVYVDDGWISALTSYIRIVVCFVSMMVTTFIWALIMLLLLPWPYERIRQGNIYGHVTGRMLMWILGNSVKIEGAKFSNEKAIYISNHASPVDIFLMMWLTPTGTVGIAKKEIIWYPLFGQLYVLANHLRIDRSNQTAAIQSMKEAACAVVKNNLSLIIFPEGTRDLFIGIANAPSNHSDGPDRYPSSMEEGQLARSASAYNSQGPESKSWGSSYVPPGFVTVNGNQPRQVDPVNDASDIMVGQVVHGVIEAAFDAGYLLTVRVGNSETTLRGVVFKPGRCVPVSTDNDVAPGIQMIRRNEIPIPRENYAQVPSHNPRSRERNGTFHTAQAANPVASKGKQVPSMASHASSPGNSRANVVPVVLHPVDLSNGTSGELSSVATQPADAVAFKGKKQEAEAKSMKLPGMPFEKLLTEVIKRTQVPSLSTKTDNGSAVNLSAKDSRRAAEDDVDGTGQPLYIEPLQSVQPVLHNHPAVVSRPLENYRTGRMTELLQENMTENQATNVQDEITDARLKLNEEQLGNRAWR
ncbi:hypothetical protein GH714_007745 [Hevea brasiliensis]|uniref:Phospholipid/glycerol acyltransferase domain-containing protein n=1 Tax=Hevea brasiliensis TaxID=3981 RepID=A0A6A6KCC5_HEVBR|nr:hypothetical protein GH714_007745 [Hevea brasiliensis]